MILGLALGANWWWQNRDFGLVFGEQAEDRLMEYPWKSSPHRIRPVADPADAFLTRLQMIREAASSIDIAVFLWRDDESSRVLFDELIRACERGVRVRILSDGVFFLRKPARVKAMAQSHELMEIRVYNPLNQELTGIDYKSLDDLGWNFDLTNHRFHIKFFTVDEEQTLIGGRNVGDRYFGFAEDYNFIDLDLLIEGDAVEQADQIFEDYWRHALTHNVLNLRDVKAATPDPQTAPNPVPARYLEGEQGSTWRKVNKMAVWADAPGVMDRKPGVQSGLLIDNLSALAAAARENLLVATPYLVMSERSHTLMEGLRENNENLQLHFLTNSLAASDNWQTYGTFHSQLQWMLQKYRLLIHLKKPNSLKQEAGAETSISSLHTKAWVVDNRWGAVGSFNWDPRSEIFNPEVMAVIEDEGFARWLREHLAPLSASENAWVVAEKALAPGVEQLDALSDQFNDWARDLTGIQAWSLSNTACYERVGDRTLTPWQDGFYDHYQSVGPFPEVKATDEKRVKSALLRPISPLLKPTL
jgi:putative cardiolipin synthase